MSIFRRLVPCLVAAATLVEATSLHAEPGIQSLDSIRKAAEEYVRARLPKAGQGTIVTAGSLDPRLRLAACSGPLHASQPAGAALQARTTVGVSCRAKASWTIYVPVTLESQIEALVLRHAAPRGARLTAANVVQQTRRVSGLGSAYVTNMAELEGRTLKRSLPVGAELTVDALADEVLVRRGQAVTLLASVGGIEVRASGKALANGRADDRIKVQNLGSLRVVEGVVESADVIRITP